jgi:hypothetical protein
LILCRERQLPVKKRFDEVLADDGIPLHSEGMPLNRLDLQRSPAQHRLIAIDHSNDFDRLLGYIHHGRIEILRILHPEHEPNLSRCDIGWLSNTDDQFRIFILKSLRDQQLDAGCTARESKQGVWRGGCRGTRLDFPCPAGLLSSRQNGKSLWRLSGLVLVKVPIVEQLRVRLLAQMFRLLDRGFFRHSPAYFWLRAPQTRRKHCDPNIHHRSHKAFAEMFVLTSICAFLPDPFDCL